MPKIKENKGDKSSSSTNTSHKERIGGNIALIGFGILQPAETIVVKKIAGNYIKKLKEVANYKEMKLRLRQHQHAKSFLHEVEAEAAITKGKITGKEIVLAAKSTQHNLYTALAEALGKIYNEASHHIRTPKEIGEERVKQERKEQDKELQSGEEDMEV